MSLAPEGDPGPAIPRVLHLLSGREKGGITRVVSAIASGPPGPDAEVVIGVLGETSAEFPAGLRVVSFDRKGPLDVLAAARLATFVRRERIRIVHTHNVTSNIYGLLLKLVMPGLIHVVHVHGQFAQILSDSRLPRLKRLLLLRGNGWALRSCDRVIAVSNVIRAFLADGLVEPDKIHVVHNGVDVAGLAREASRACPAAEAVAARRADEGPGGALSPRVGVVGAFGRLAPVKNYPMFLRAASLVLREERAVFAVVGEGPEQARLEELAAELGIGSDVLFTGWLANPYPLLATVDVVASTSSTEGFPVGLLEAIALARPVVATEVGAVAEIVRHEATGIVVPSGDAEALARALVRLLREPLLRRDLGSRGQEVARAEFSVDRTREQVEQVYIAALERQGLEVARNARA